MPINNIKACTLYLGSVALLTSSLCLAQELPHSEQPYWYLGIGAAQLHLDNDHPAIGSRSGTGPYLVGGIKFFDRLSFELSSAATNITVGPTSDPNLPQPDELIYYPADSAEYYNLLMSIRLGFFLTNYPKLQPWLATGFAYHYYSWDTYWYLVKGSAPYIGTGIDIRIGPRWDIRLEANHSSYDSSDNYGSGSFASSTTQFDAAVVYSFR